MITVDEIRMKNIEFVNSVPKIDEAYSKEYIQVSQETLYQKLINVIDLQVINAVDIVYLFFDGNVYENYILLNITGAKPKQFPYSRFSRFHVV